MHIGAEPESDSNEDLLELEVLRNVVPIDIGVDPVSESKLVSLQLESNERVVGFEQSSQSQSSG
jgi:hypothetical protein